MLLPIQSNSELSMLSWSNALNIGKQGQAVWNSHPRLRLGMLIMGMWGIAIPLIRSLPPGLHWVVSWSSIGVLSIGFGLATNAVVSIFCEWRSIDLPDVDDEWMESDSAEPDKQLPTSLGDGYEYLTTRSISVREMAGQALAWGLLLWWAALWGLVMIVLWRPTPADPFGFEDISMVIFVLSVLGGMMIVHEGLHGVAARYYGAEVSYGVNIIGPYTQYTDVVLSRRQNVLIIALPLLVLTPLAAAATLFAEGLIVYVGVIVLLFNTVLSGGDVYQIGYRLYQSPGTVFSITANGEILVYQPKNPQNSLLAQVDTGIERVTEPLKLPDFGNKADKL
jgi:hypothetical protein